MFFSQLMGIEIAKKLGNYLGMPLLYDRVRKSTFSFLVDKIGRKTLGFKAKLLSRVARALLVHTTTFAIPGYAMQIALVPDGVVVEIDWLNRNFLWSDVRSKCGLNLVAWENVYLPKEMGGIGDC